MAPVFLRAAAGLALLTGLLACTPAPQPIAPRTPVTPTSGGFSPLRAQSIAIPGQGAWECTPSGKGAMSGCQHTTQDQEGARPGVLPLRSVGGVEDLEEQPGGGTPFVMPVFDAEDEIPMQQPG